MGSSLLLWLALLAQPAKPAPAPAAQAQKEKEAAPAARDPLPEYVIGPGDGLELFVWKEGDLTRTLHVRVDGRITVPLLGDIVADGKTAMGLARELTTALGRFVEAPVVNVIVGQANNARVYVIGEVKSTGALPMTGRMTILQALVQSGGFAQFADKNSILIIRGKKTLKVNYDKIKDGSDLSQNVLLEMGDTIVVP